MPKLRSYQLQALTWLSTRPKAFLALEQGLGKTAVAAVDISAGKTLVICPATLKLNWAAELAMWRPDLKVQVILKATTPVDTEADVWIVNYDIISKVNFPPLANLIADESHYLKSPQAKRTKHAVKLIKQTPKVRLLSGTPVVNRPVELFSTLKAIDALKLDYISYGRRYCAGWQTPWGSFDASGASNLNELYEKLSPFMLRMTKAEVLKELPAKSYRVIELDLPICAEEKRLVKSQIDLPKFSVPFEAIADILKMNAQRKLPLAVEHIENVLRSEEKVVIFAWHTDIINQLAEALKAYGVVTLTGATPNVKRQANVVAFQSCSKESPRVFIGNIKAAGVGITLTASAYVVFVESTWTPADLHQAADRTHRIGQKRSVQIDILTISKSIDAIQLHKILDKTELITHLVKETKMLPIRLQEISATLTEIANELIAMTESADTPPPKKVRAKPLVETVEEPVPAKELKIDDLRLLAGQKLKADPANAAKLSKILADKFCVKLSELSSSEYQNVYNEIEQL